MKKKAASSFLMYPMMWLVWYHFYWYIFPFIIYIYIYHLLTQMEFKGYPSIDPILDITFTPGCHVTLRCRYTQTSDSMRWRLGSHWELLVIYFQTLYVVWFIISILYIYIHILYIYAYIMYIYIYTCVVYAYIYMCVCTHICIYKCTMGIESYINAISWNDGDAMRL
jgi:hypothetical protein